MQKALFRVVENGKHLNRLRNGYLEKSVATGICRVQRSPKTAKTPAKVHLRLRFQNPGKPRTAGLSEVLEPQSKVHLARRFRSHR